MLPEYDFSFQLYPRHDAHVKAYHQDFLNQLLFGGYASAGKSQMYYMDERSWIQKPVTQDTNTDQTYKKRKHIPNNQEAQKDRKAKLLSKNKFFNK